MVDYVAFEGGEERGTVLGYFGCLGRDVNILLLLFE
jgi:hypothetical protein